MKVLLLAVVVLVVVGFLFWGRDQPATPTATPGGNAEEKSSPHISPPGVSPAAEPAAAPASSPTPARAAVATGTAPPSTLGTAPSPGQADMPEPDGASPPPPAAGDAEVNAEQIAADLDELSLGMRDYRTLAAENPIGTNQEITEALMGKNRTGARLAPQNARVNAKGEMMDRWGTAYFFHQVSATTMEIHSAGPDRKMGTEDDIIHQ